MAAPKKKTGNGIVINPAVFKIAYWILGIVAAFVIILVGIAAFYEKGIGSLVIQELKKALKTDLQVESAELSLVWEFPRASVTLKNVKLKGLGKDSTKQLLVAENISLKCGMFGLLAGNYTFNRIEIKNASLYVYYDKDGKPNYDIFKTVEEKKSESTKLNLSIENATFTNVKLEYIDEKFKHEVKIRVSSAFFAGSFTDTRYEMKSYANITSDYIKIGKEDIYLQNKELGYNAVIDIDNKKNIYSLKKVELIAEGNKFETEGKISSKPEGIDMDIWAKTDKARLSSLLKLLPTSFKKSLGGFESNANLNFDAKLKGLYSAKSIPKTDIKFGLKNGRLSHPKMASELKGVRFDVSFFHKGGHSRKDGTFRLDNFKGTLGGNPIELKLSMEGLENPKIDFSFNGTIPLKSMFGLLGEDVSKGQGDVRIDEISLKGNFSDMIDPRRISKVELSGALSFIDAGVILNDIPLVLQHGSIELRDNALKIKNLQFKSQKSDMLIDGNFQNLLPVIFSDSTNSQKAELGFQASLKSEKIDADELMAAFTSKSAVPENSKKSEEQLKDSLAQEKNEKREFFTQFLHGIFKAEVGEITYGKIVAKNMRGQLMFENNELKIMGFRLDAMKGNVGLNAKVFFEKEPYLLAFFDCEKVDMFELLDKTDNFGQTTLTSQNLRGELSSVIKINAFWDAQGNFLDKELIVIADVALKNGELIDFELLNSLGAFVKIKDLERIRFSELNTQFIVQNAMFHLPATFIQSNAINLTISGKHYFNQDIDYKFKINAGQVIAQKFKKHNPDLPLIPARQKGIFNIYAMVSGNIDNDEYKFKLGKKNVKKQLDAELTRELGMVSNILRGEFERSDLFDGPNGGAKAATTTAKITKLSEPEEWKDVPDGDEKGAEPEYIEGF